MVLSKYFERRQTQRSIYRQASSFSHDFHHNSTHPNILSQGARHSLPAIFHYNVRRNRSRSDAVAIPGLSGNLIYKLPLSNFYLLPLLMSSCHDIEHRRASGGSTSPPPEKFTAPPCFKNSTPQAFSINTTRVFLDRNPKIFLGFQPNMLFSFYYNSSPKVRQKTVSFLWESLST